MAPCPSCGRDVPDEADACPYCETRWDTSTRDDAVDARTIAGTGTAEVTLDDPAEDRYTIIDELGQGGMGKIYLAFDRRLRRNVACKVLRSRAGGDGKPSVPDPEQVARFVSECQAAAQIEHPNVVPIYDFGQRREDGAVYFTMKYIEGKNLGDHIRGMKSGAHEPGMTRFRLLQILHQVMLAVSYMHKKNVLHRDIKPQNVMVGQFGEVYLVDFGLHKVRGRAVSTVRTEAGQDTPEVVVQGTPAYMPPEQVEDPEEVDETSDQWALGAVLYEILTHQPPYGGPATSIWARALAGTFPRPSEIDPDVPKPLEEICVKAMAKRRHERFETVKEMARRLQEFLDGEKEIARREKLGAEALAEARRQLEAYTSLDREAADLERQHRQARAALPAGASSEDRAHVRRIGDRHQRLSELAADAFPGVTHAYVRAIDVLPSARVAREELSDLAFREFLEAERGGRRGEMRVYRALVESYHDGRYARQLVGDGSIAFSSEPPGAHVYLAPYGRSGPRLVAGEETYLGATATGRSKAAMGSYIATLRMEGRTDARLPLTVGRCEDVEVTVRLLPAEALRDGFAFVPEGRFLKGGDPFDPESELHEAYLPPFCISRNPVTVEEYLGFLNALAADEGLAAARKRVPRVSPQPASEDGFYFVWRGARFELPPKDADDDAWDLRWPVPAISVEDAEAYCSWRARLDGVPYRLPTSDEWEKAARGADGRKYPWGDGWEDGFAHTLRDSSRRAPEPVGARPSDVSPFGMLGAAGNIQDWTATRRRGSEHLRAIRGGSFGEGERVAEIPVLYWRPAASVSTGVGFRMAYTPFPD